MKKFLYLALSLVLFLGTSCKKTELPNPTQTVQEPEVTLRLAELHVETYPTTLACHYFADEVSKRTHGRVKIDIYSQGRLGTEIETIEAIQDGTIDIGRINCLPLAEYSPNITPVTLPYVFDNDKHLEAVLSSDIGDKMLNNMAGNFVGLAWYYSGSRCFYFKNPAPHVDDVKGLNIRVQNSPLMEEFITSMGANPIQADWADIYNMLDDNTLDGAENDILSYETAVHNAVAHYYILDKHSFTPSILLTNSAVLDKLSESDQAILRDCATDSQEYEFDLWREYESKSISALEESGTTFIEPTEEDFSKLNELIQPLYSKYAKNYTDVIDEIKNTKY